MISLLEELGGKLETGVRVDSLDELGSPDIVMLDVAPAAAARIAGDRMPRRIARALERYRHGPGAGAHGMCDYNAAHVGWAMCACDRARTAIPRRAAVKAASVPPAWRLVACSDS
jgi:hypothetical protein